MTFCIEVYATLTFCIEVYATDDFFCMEVYAIDVVEQLKLKLTVNLLFKI